MSGRSNFHSVDSRRRHQMVAGGAEGAMVNRRAGPRRGTRAGGLKGALGVRRKVLLVGPDVPSLGFYHDILEGLGLHVLSCPNYKASLAHQDSGPWGLVVAFQQGSTFEARPVLERAIEIEPRAVVLVVTRYFDVGTYFQAIQLGAAGYLREPVTVRQMVQWVKIHLRVPTGTEFPA